MPLTVPSSLSVSVAAHDLGGDGAVLLLAHGTGLHGRLFEPFVRHLEGFHAWAPDLRGHGDSSLPEDLHFAWGGFADDIAAVVAEIGDGVPIFGFGHSMGSAASLLAEARKPGTFRALYCYEPIVIPPFLDATPEQQSRFREATRRRRRSFPSVETAFENYSAKPPFNAFEDDFLRSYIEHGFEFRSDDSIRIKMDPDHEALVYEMNSEHPTYDLLPEIRCPVAVARGRIEPGPSQWAETVVSRLPDARLEPFDDLGHMGPFEDSKRVAEAASTFFAEAGG